ncbi:MAG: hypothetical protein EOR04_11230 [Mesorhizobium sp.]|nr:MAG: hypothetical protein EOR04_11230 [Mesorhizobium sp.]
MRESLIVVKQPAVRCFQRQIVGLIGRCEYLACVGNIGGDAESLAALVFDFRCQLAESRFVAGDQRRR